MTAVKIKKRLVLLPPEVNNAFATLTDPDQRDDYIRILRSKGWTLEAIAKVCGVSRERIRQIALTPHTNAITTEALPIPNPPLVEQKPKPVYVEPHPETLARLLELQPYAKQVRSKSTKYRAEAEEYTKLLAHAHFEEGVTLYRLAKRLNVTHPAIRFRLARYGYKPSANGTSKVYTPIKTENRVL